MSVGMATVEVGAVSCVGTRVHGAMLDGALRFGERGSVWVRTGKDWGRRAVRRLPSAVWVVVLYLGMALAWMAPVWFAKSAAVPTVAWRQFAPDSPTYVWFLAWVPYAIGHGWSPYSSGWLNAPFGANLAYPGPPLPWIVLMWPVTAAIGVVKSYDVLVVVGIVSTAIAAWWACRYWFGGGFGAVLGGAMFGFSPYVLGQMEQGHVNLGLVAGIPLSSVVFYELVVSQRRSPRFIGLCAGGLGAVQLLTSQEVAAIVGITGVLVILALVIIYPNKVRERVPYVVRAMLWAAPAIVASSGVIVWAQVLSVGAVHGDPAVGEVAGSSSLLSILAPSYGEALTLQPLVNAQLVQNAYPNEALGYLGIPMILLLVSLSRRSEQMAKWLAGLVVLIAALMLGPKLQVGGVVTPIPLPMDVLGRLPLVHDILPSRFSGMLDWLAALSVAVFVRGLAGSRQVRSGSVLTCLALAFWFPNVGAPVLAVPIPRYFSEVAVPRSSSLFVVPFAQTSLGAISEVWQASSGMRFRMTGGYYLRTGLGAGANMPYGPPVTPLTRAVLLTMGGDTRVAATPNLQAAAASYFAVRKVWAVAIGPSQYQLAETRLFTALLDRTPVWVGSVATWKIGG